MIRLVFFLLLTGCSAALDFDRFHFDQDASSSSGAKTDHDSKLHHDAGAELEHDAGGAADAGQVDQDAHQVDEHYAGAELEHDGGALSRSFLGSWEVSRTLSTTTCGVSSAHPIKETWTVTGSPSRVIAVLGSSSEVQRVDGPVDARGSAQLEGAAGGYVTTFELELDGDAFTGTEHTQAPSGCTTLRGVEARRL